MRNGQRGAALVIALIALVVLSASAFSLVLVMDTELRIAAAFSSSREAMYAAEGALEIAARELLAAADWNLVLAGSALSTFVDGAPAGTRPLPDGRIVSLEATTDTANDEPRPWGPNNPQWSLFAYGPIGPSAYTIVWAADDPLETDGDARVDGAGEANPGAGILALRAEAFGTAGAHAILEATVRRGSAASGEATLEMLSWHIVR